MKNRVSKILFFFGFVGAGVGSENLSIVEELIESAKVEYGRGREIREHTDVFGSFTISW